MRERLQKILSAHGVASRRESEELIMSGRVAVNGVRASLGERADIWSDEITVDGKRLESKCEKIYIMLNKPRGYVTTMKDERDRKTVTQLITDVQTRVYPVGRLDMDSEGLLLLTNDGKFANIVMHPSYGKEKVYRVTVNGDVPAAAQKLREPMRIDGHMVKAKKVEVESKRKQSGTLKITIGEGRNRQIRKMCAQCGLEVRKLERISIGAVKLGGLETGRWRHLTDNEIKVLMREGL